MEQYKHEFIDFLLSTGALKIGQDWTLKSDRKSPYFVNTGDFNDGFSSGMLGKYYGEVVKQFGQKEIYYLVQRIKEFR